MSRAALAPAADGTAGVAAAPVWRRALLAALPPLLLLGLAVLFFHNAWAAPRSTTVGVRGDADATIWYHAWVRHAVAHRVFPLLSDHLNAPDGINLTWQTAQPLTGWASWPVAAAAGPYAAYDVVATLAVALSAWCAYLVIRRRVPRRIAAFAGALLYGFSPYMAAHSLGHLNLTTAFTPPLLLAVLDEMLVRQRRAAARSGLLLGALVTLQLFVAEELLATEALMGTAAVVVLALLHPQQVRRHAAHAVRALLVAAAVLLVCGGWLLAVQFRGPHRLGGTFQHPGGFSTDLLQFVVPTSVQQLQPQAAERVATHFTGNLSEQTAYLGLPLLLILASTCWRFRHVAWVRVVAWLGAVAAVLSLGPTLHVRGHATHIPLPWVVLEHTPVLANLVPSRLMVYGYLMVALLLALFVDQVLRLRPAGAAMGGALVLAALALLLPRFDFPASAHDDPPFFTADVQRIAPGSSVLVAPFVSGGDEVDPEAWQALGDMRFRMPGGYFLQPDPDDPGSHLLGPVPRPLSATMLSIEQGAPPPPLTGDLRARFDADLQHWQVRWALVGPMPHREAMVAFLTELLGSAPEQDQGVMLWPIGQPVVLRAASAPMSWSYTYTSKRS
jgi:hypothetical protein